MTTNRRRGSFRAIVRQLLVRPLLVRPSDIPTPYRFADLSVIVVQEKAYVLAVCEDHTDPAPSMVRNSIVFVSLQPGSECTDDQPRIILASGMDFYSGPTYNPESIKLAFVAWNHPHMPWNGTTLFVQTLVQPETRSLSPPTTPPFCDGPPVAVHGGSKMSHSLTETVSVYAPQWFGRNLFFLSDVSGWHNLYVWKDGSQSNDIQAIYKKEADFSEPKCGWILGCRCFAFVKENLVATYADGSKGSHIVFINTNTCQATEFGRSCLPPTSIDSLCASGDMLYFVGGSVTEPRALWCWERPGDATCVAKQLVSSLNVANLEHLHEFFSMPELIQAPSSDIGVGFCYAYYYPPPICIRHSKPIQSSPRLYSSKLTADQPREGPQHFDSMCSFGRVAALPCWMLTTVGVQVTARPIGSLYWESGVF